VIIDWFTTVAQIVNFLILVFLLRHFLYGPITRAMAQREAKIAARLEEADAMRQEAAHEAETFRRRNQELEDEQQKMLRQAKEETEAWRQELVAKAREEMDRTRTRWYTAIRQEQDAFVEDIRQRTAHQVVAIARRALADLADAELEQHLIHVFVQRLQDPPAKGQQEVAESLRQTASAVLVRSAFELPSDSQQMIRKVVEKYTDDEIDLQFETASDLVYGIELIANGYRLAWTVDDYLQSLEEDLRQALEEKVAAQEEDETHGTDDDTG
jgi:F-type H+-transporting ATPase subunit b